MLSQDGLRDALLQAFTLSRDIYLSQLDSLEPVLAARCSGQRERQAFIAQGIWEAFADELKRLFAGRKTAWVRPCSPACHRLCADEVVAETPGELYRLRQRPPVRSMGAPHYAETLSPHLPKPHACALFTPRRRPQARFERIAVVALDVERIVSPRAALGGCRAGKNPARKNSTRRTHLHPLPPARPVSEFCENPGGSETVPPGRAVTGPCTGKQNFIL